jgi:hypothetical protein
MDMSSAQLFTSNFALIGNSPGGVAICRRPPFWFQGDRLLDIAPTSAMLRDVRNGDITDDEFDDLYLQILKSGDTDDILRSYMHRSVTDQQPFYFLCFEGRGKRCHRTQFAQYMWMTYRFQIPEYQGGRITRSSMLPHNDPEPTVEGNVVTDTTGDKWDVNDNGTITRQTEMLDLDSFTTKRPH